MHCISPCAFPAALAIINVPAPNFSHCIKYFGCAGNFCGFLAWYFIGIYWRFSYTGKFISGEFNEDYEFLDHDAWVKLVNETDYGVQEPLYQYSNGYFMYWFYVISWIVFFSFTCCCYWGSLISTNYFGSQRRHCGRFFEQL